MMDSGESIKEDSGDMGLLRSHCRVSFQRETSGHKRTFFLVEDVGQLIHFTIW